MKSATHLDTQGMASLCGLVPFWSGDDVFVIASSLSALVMDRAERRSAVVDSFEVTVASEYLVPTLQTWSIVGRVVGVRAGDLSFEKGVNSRSDPGVHAPLWQQAEQT